MTDITKEEIENVIAMIDHVPDYEKRRILELLERLEKEKEKKICQSNFLPFVKHVWPGFIDGSHHKIIADAFDRVISGKLKRVIINMPPRHRLALNTDVLTTSGWKTIETIQVGDYVYGSDGKPQRVIGKSDIYEEQLYSVKTDDGETFITDAEHRWKAIRSVRRSTKGKRTTSQEQVVVSTNDISNCLLRPKRATRLIDRVAVQLEPIELPIDPYVFGIWLGDGHNAQAVVTSDDDDSEIVRAEIERRGYKTTDQSTPRTFGILGLKTKLRDIGVLGNKHIPDMYLHGSIEQRYDLLRALMDTDGNVSQKGQCFFAQSDREIIDSFRKLLWSLGIKNTISSYIPILNGVKHKRAYKVSFYANDVSTLPRKKERCFAPRGFGRHVYVTAKPLGKTGKVQCIQVENKDQVFLVGRSLIPTMNTKSEFASIHLPAYYLGRNPDAKIIQATHTAELAVEFGRKVRNLVDSDPYQEIFDNVKLAADSKAAGRWSTNHKGGDYFAVGVGGAVAGRGADLFIIDDPIDEQTALYGEYKPEVYQKIYEWYTLVRQRLQPGGSIIIVMTRWSQRDLTARLVKDMTERMGADQWEVIQLPAIMPSGQPVWPEYWSLEELESVKASIPLSRWNAQYQQNPTSEESALIKRSDWQEWRAPRPPEKILYSMVAWDTAFEKTERANYSACTRWGVFEHEDENTGKKRNCLILLDAFRGKWSFPELKRIVKDQYMKDRPDTILIERRATGAPLIQELRAMGIPVQDYMPVRGASGQSNDKIARVNSITDIFASKIVFAPTSRWAEEVIEECASFPAGENDDYVDTVSMAMMRFRKGGFLRTELDAEDEDDIIVNNRKLYW